MSGANFDWRLCHGETLEDGQSETKRWLCGNETQRRDRGGKSFGGFHMLESLQIISI